jgi:hypothetical protein
MMHAPGVHITKLHCFASLLNHFSWKRYFSRCRVLYSGLCVWRRTCPRTATGTRCSQQLPFGCVSVRGRPRNPRIPIYRLCLKTAFRVHMSIQGIREKGLSKTGVSCRRLSKSDPEIPESRLLFLSTKPAVGNSPYFGSESPTDLDNIIIILMKSRYCSRQLANISDHVTWS